MKTKSPIQARPETLVESSRGRLQKRPKVGGGKLAALTLAGLALGLTASPVHADLFTAAWPQGAPGIWEQDSVWSTTAYPNNGHFVVINGNPIPGPNPTYDVLIGVATPCTLGIGVRVQAVNILQGSTLNLGSGGYLWANTGFANAGLITLNSTGNFTGLFRSGGDSNVVAGGEIFMSDHGSNSVTAGSTGKVLTIAAGGRIRGAGFVNAYHGDDVRTYFQIVNHGLIEAMQPINQLRIMLTDDAAFTNSMVNDGTLRASGQGVLWISNFNNFANVLNQGGTIEAIDNGTVRVRVRSTITGGTLATSGNGTIRGDYSGVAGGSGYGGTLKDVLNKGTIVLGTGENIGLAGVFTNDGGQVRIDGNASDETGLLMRSPEVTLAGNGVITMNATGGIAGGDTPGQTMIVNNGFTIRGNGSIGTLSSAFLYKPLKLVNHGLIESTAGMTIYVRSTDNTNATNDGILRAANGGLLRLEGPGSVFNSGGTIEALTGSTVRLFSGVTVEGGALTSSGTGEFRGGAEGGGTYNNITNTGTLVSGANEFLYLAGTLTNNGVVRIDDEQAGGNASLLTRGNVVLAGNGLIAMNGQSPGLAGADAIGDTLTVSPGVTIRGNGQIGTDNSNFTYKGLNLVNHGLIEATTGMTIYVNSSQNSNVANDGILRAANGASYLQFNGPGAVVNNNGGTIEALGTSNLLFTGGATLTNNAGATIALNGGTLTVEQGLDLNGGSLIGHGTIEGPVRNNGGTISPGFSPGKITVNGSYTQGATGVMTLEIGGAAAGTGYDQLQVSGAVALGGTLNISLINGFRPAIGDVFPFILPGSFTGAFSTINTTGFTGQVNYSPSSITMTVLTVGGVTPTPSPTPTATPTATPSKLLNIATRMRVQTGENVLIGGFIITGTDSKSVIIRGIGPSLSSFFSGVLANPTLELFQGSTLLQSNNDWKDTQRIEIEATGLQPSNDFESAILRTLPPGAYTAVVRGNGNTSGIGVVEAYDLNQTANSKFANIATRGFVEAGDNVMIGGLIIGPAAGSTAKVVVRAIGPSLTAFGITGALQDPTVDLKDASGTTLSSNDDWQQGLPAELQLLGLAPTDPRESALIATLAPGAYTAIVRGAGNTAGVALVEVYHVQ